MEAFVKAEWMLPYKVRIRWHLLIMVNFTDCSMTSKKLSNQSRSFPEVQPKKVGTKT